MELFDKIQCVRLYLAIGGNCNAVMRQLYSFGIESRIHTLIRHLIKLVAWIKTIEPR